MGPRIHMRINDRARRHRPHTAVPDSRVPCRHGGRNRSCAGGTGRNLVDQAPLHGTPSPVGRHASRLRRRPSFHHRRPNRQLLSNYALCLLPSAFCLLPSAFCLLLPAACRLPPASCLLPPHLGDEIVIFRYFIPPV